MAKTPTLNVREASDSHGGVLPRITGPRRVPVSREDGAGIEYLSIDEIAAEGPPGPAGEGAGSVKNPVYIAYYDPEDPVSLTGDGGKGTPDNVRVAVLDQPVPVNNGIYRSNTAGPWGREADWADGDTVLNGVRFEVSATKETVILDTADPVVVGTTPTSFIVRSFIEGVPSDEGRLVAIDADGKTAKSLARVASAIPTFGQTWRADADGVMQPADSSAALVQDAPGVVYTARSKIQVPGAHVFDDPAADRTVIGLDRVTLKGWGGSHVDTTTTATGTAGSVSVTLVAENGWKNGNSLFFERFGAAHGLAAPAAPTVHPQGTAGGTTWSVIILWRTATGGQSAAGTPTVITTANATLDQSNFLEVWPESVPEGAYRADVYAQRAGTGGTHTWRGAAIAWPMIDGHSNVMPAKLRIYSNTAPTPPAGIKASITAAADTTPTPNGLFAKIVSGGGTTAIVLDTPVKTSGAGVTVRTCNRLVAEDAMRSIGAVTVYNGGEFRPEGGVYPFASDFRVQTSVSVRAARCGLQANGCWFKFIDGFGAFIDNSTFAQQRGPGEQIRLGDRRQAVHHELHTNAVFEATNVGSGTYGYTATGGDPAWNFTNGATTTDGDVTWTCRGTGVLVTAFGCEFKGVGLMWTGMRSPIGRHVTPRDLDLNYSQTLAAFGGGSWQWQANTVVALGAFCVPPVGSETGKMYECTSAGTTGASPPTFKRLVADTTNDNTVVWTTRDIPQVQGSGLTVTAGAVEIDTTIAQSTSTGPSGNCIHLDGASTQSGGATSRAKLRAQLTASGGGGVVVTGIDAQLGSIEFHSYNIGQIDGAAAYLDDSDYGNRVVDSSINVGGFYQTPGKVIAAKQKHSIFDNCYSEGSAPAHRVYFPALRIGGVWANGNAGTALEINGGSSPTQPYSMLGAQRDSGSTIERTLSGGIDYYRVLNAAAAFGTPELRRGKWDSTRARMTTSYGATPITHEEVWGGARGKRPCFPQGLEFGGDQSLFAITNTSTTPTSGVVSQGDIFGQVFGGAALRYRLFCLPDKYGYLGSSPGARADSTNYAFGTLVTSSGRTFVACNTVTGASASSPPAALASAVIGQRITDGNVVWECWGTDQATMRGFSDMHSEPVALTDADQTVHITGGNVRQCASATRSPAILLGTTNYKPGDSIRFENHYTVAQTWTFTNGGPGGTVVGTMPVMTLCWIEFTVTNALNWYQSRAGIYLP